MQEARFAGACQDQHAGRPAPSLGWPGRQAKGWEMAETAAAEVGAWREAAGTGYPPLPPPILPAEKGFPSP